MFLYSVEIKVQFEYSGLECLVTLKWWLWSSHRMREEHTFGIIAHFSNSFLSAWTRCPQRRGWWMQVVQTLFRELHFCFSLYMDWIKENNGEHIVHSHTSSGYVISCITCCVSHLCVCSFSCTSEHQLLRNNRWCEDHQNNMLYSNGHLAYTSCWVSAILTKRVCAASSASLTSPSRPTDLCCNLEIALCQTQASSPHQSAARTCISKILFVFWLWSLW